MKLIHLRAHETFGPFKVAAGQRLELIVYTKSLGGANFTVFEESKGSLCNVSVIHNSNHSAGSDAFDAEKSTHVDLASNTSFGPGSYKIRADSKTSRLHTDNYLLSVRVLKQSE